MTTILMPNYVPPASTSRSVTPRATINRVASRTLRLAVAGEGALIPDGYGRVRHHARIPTVAAWGNRRLLLCVWQTGPIDAIEKVYIGDAQYTGPANHYLGTTTQSVDPWLAAAISGWTAALPGKAYSVLRLEQGQDISPAIYADVRGRKVYDPRSETYAWSQNPGLILADAIVRLTGRDIDWSSVADVADACDELVGGKPRRQIGLVMDRAARVDEWIATLREYAGAYIIWSDPVRLVPDRPRAVDHVIGPEHIREPNLRRRALDGTVNRVVVEYTRISGAEWKTQRAATPYPSGEILAEQVVRLPGIQEHAQAMRQAEERLARLRHGMLEGEPVVDDIGLAIVPGDVLSITHPLGLQDALFRVVDQPVAVEPGFWRVPVEQYSESHYSDSTASAPDEPITALPDPFAVPAMDPPTVVEEVYQLQTGDWSTRLRVTWAAASYDYTHQYHVEVKDGDGELVWSGDTRGLEYVTGAVQELVTYTITVAVVGLGGVTGSPGTAHVTAQGKYLPPGDVPQITALQVDADAVQARWQPAIDVDIYRYELRIGDVGASWEEAELVDLIDGLQARIEGLSLGQYDLLIRALDSVRNLSPTVTRTTVEVKGPQAPASIAAFEVGGEVRLSWPEGQGYVSAYALRYGPVAGDWDSAIQLDRVQALRYMTREIPAGTWRIYVRSVDTAGNLSAGYAATTVEVTLDTAAFLVGTITWSNPSLTAMTSWSHRPKGRKPTHYVTDSGETAAARWPLAMSAYTEPLAVYQTGVASEWLSEVHDIGLQVTGDWRLTGGWDALAGTVTAVLELSGDGITFDPQPALSVKASARYARVRLSATSGSVLHVVREDVTLRIDALAREETGEVVTSASSPTTVVLARAYGAVQAITLTPQGSTAAAATYDNIVLGSPSSFDIYVFDATGAQVSRPVRWLFKGI